MISKNKIKFLKSLSIKKYRNKYNAIIIEGRRLIEESINLKADIQNIWFTEDALDTDSNKNLISSLKALKISYDLIEDKDLKYISDTKNNQGMIAEVKLTLNKGDLSKNNHIVILDSISDPGNLGTIFRTCAWYGIKSVIITENTVDPYNLKCIRAALGSHFYFKNIYKMSNHEILDFIKEKKYQLICADLNGEGIESIGVEKKWAIIFGSESDGIHIDFKMFPKLSIQKLGNMESLNVSVACGIILDQLFTKFKG
tara:strand:+ start:1524 stop:2291 length:768 start_codon:yes stop_codon:yes gene_type:complete